MWNFNNGSQLKEFTHHEPHMEFSSLAFIHDSHKQSNQVGIWHWPLAFLFLSFLFVSGCSAMLAASCTKLGLRSSRVRFLKV